MSPSGPAPYAAPVPTEEAWRALNTTVVVAPLPRVGSLRVAGPDRIDFLHGQLAHDVRGLTVGGARRSLLLDEKGHARAEVDVHRREDDVHLAVLDGGLVWVHDTLRRHVVFDQVALEALPERLATLTVQGPRVAETLTSLGWPVPGEGAFATAPFAGSELLLVRAARSGPGGVDVHVLRDRSDGVVAALREAGAVPIEPDLLEPSRIAASLPRAGIEGGRGVLPQEAGLVDRISTRKGCYLGQEIMARIEARGTLKRGLAGLRLEGEAAALEALRAEAPGGVDADATSGGGGENLRDLLLDGRKVGLLGGMARHPELGWIALAVLRHDVGEGDALTPAAAPGVRATRAALPFG